MLHAGLGVGLEARRVDAQATQPERAPEMHRLVDRIDRATRTAPGFRHKVVQAPSRLANPRWVVDPDFDLTFHVRHISLPAPGTLAEVFDYARQTGMAAFDRDRPLWEITLADGLDDGRVAVVMKLHHALTDGIGGMEMAKYLFDLEPRAPSPSRPWSATADRPPCTTRRRHCRSCMRRRVRS